MSIDGITIAIPTRNRAAILAKTLDGLRALNVTGAGAFEILVIDNDSSDETSSIATGHGARLVHERRLGLNFARNRAIHEARFDVVAFLDDDVDVDPNWLIGLRRAYERSDAAAIGGRAHLVFPGDRPTWLDARDEGYLTKVELGDQPREVEADEIYGVNFSVRRDRVRAVGGFRTDIGRIGGGLMGGDELELLERLKRSGGTLMYEPNAIVGHRIDPHRLTRTWFWRRCYEGQFGDAMMMPAGEITVREVARRSWYLLRAAKSVIAAGLKSGLRSAACFHEVLNLASRLGRCSGVTQRWLMNSHDIDSAPELESITG